ncbi:MAG: hypothetical protein MZW92_53925 [Comamonadaceae bacterium]|nr:hypothetical protein [Comamonadaceae bacterium]
MLKPDPADLRSCCCSGPALVAEHALHVGRRRGGGRRGRAPRRHHPGLGQPRRRGLVRCGFAASR